MEAVKNVPKLRFSGFSGEWGVSKLKEITTYVDYRGKAPNKSKEGHFLVTAKNIKKGYIDYQCSKEFVSISDYSKVMSKGLPKLGDVLFTTEAPMGNVALVNIDNIALAQRVIKFRGNSGIENQYLLHYFLSETFQKTISKKAIGTTVQGISGKELHNTFVFYPTLPEQQKIANFLSSVDSYLSQLKEKKDLLEQYKKGMMQQLFSQQIRFKDENDEDFPEWEEKKLGEIVNFLDNRRKPIKSSDREKMKGMYPYYGASGIIDYVNEYIFNEEIILLGEDGENIISRNLPLAFRVSGKCWVNNHAHVLEPLNMVDIDFLTYELDRINYTKYNTGTAQPKLNKDICSKIPINLPQLKEQQKIANFLSSIDKKIDQVNTQIEASEQYKKGLLQQLFV